MDSQRRSKRPHLVERAARKLRGESSNLSTGTDDALPQDDDSVPGHASPHLAVVSAMPASDLPRAGDGDMEPPPPDEPIAPRSQPPRRSRVKPALLLLLLILLSMVAFWAVHESRTSSMQAKF